MTDETRQSPAETVSHDERYQNRDDRNGQFTFDGNMARMCVCGHQLGDHFAAAPHECCIDTDPSHPLYPTNCKCEKFRLSRRRTVAGTGKKRIAHITRAGRRELGGTIAGKVGRR